jgi:hypothetical protein
MMKVILEQNEDMRGRLASLEADSSSIATSRRHFSDEDDSSTIRPSTIVIDQKRSVARTSILADRSKFANDGIPYTTILPQREFEVALQASKVYRRAEPNEEDTSFASSAMGTDAWSMLSKFSLAKISVISVVSLPLSQEEAKTIRLASSRVGELRLNNSPTVHRNIPIAPIAADATAPLHTAAPPKTFSYKIPKGKMEFYKVVVLGDHSSGMSAFTIQVSCYR